MPLVNRHGVFTFNIRIFLCVFNASDEKTPLSYNFFQNCSLQMSSFYSLNTLGCLYTNHCDRSWHRYSLIAHYHARVATLPDTCISWLYATCGPYFNTVHDGSIRTPGVWFDKSKKNPEKWAAGLGLPLVWITKPPEPRRCLILEDVYRLATSQQRRN